MSTEIEAGSKEQLISGGRYMTVEKIVPWQGEQEARCCWFLNGELKTGQFRLSSLQVVPREEARTVVGSRDRTPWS